MKSNAGLCGSRQRPKVRTKVEPAAADTAVSLSKRAAIIGREKEIESIRDSIRRRKGLHLHGPTGVGKSALLDHLHQHWDKIGGDYSFTGNLAYCLYLVPKLGIENLKKKDAFILMQQRYNELGMKLPDKVRVFNDIFHISQGNPKVIHDILDKARKPDYIVDGKLNLNLIVIDCRMDEVRIS